MSIEAMKQGLEALNYLQGIVDTARGPKAAEALRQAIAEAEKQEQVAWVNWCAATGKRSVSFECESELASQPLYFGITQNTQDHYSKREPLTDEQIKQVLDDCDEGQEDAEYILAFARAIEAAHGIKENT